MSRQFWEDFDCPHCGQGFNIDVGDAVFTDHVEDGCAEKCSECGGWYQLRCVSASAEVECTAAPPETHR